jgi:hypothetical protein
LLGDCGHRLAYGHLKDLDVIAERLERQVTKLREVPPQVLRKIYSPS